MPISREFQQVHDSSEVISLLESYQAMKADAMNREREFLVRIVRASGSLSRAAKSSANGKDNVI